MRDPTKLTEKDFPLPPLDAEGKLISVGNSVRILSVASCARGLPAEDQERLLALEGKVRVVVEFDRSGFVWLSLAAHERRANFCLIPTEVSLVAPV